jgi:hypothetical protein
MFKTVHSRLLAAARVADNKNCILRNFFLLDVLNTVIIIFVENSSGLCVGEEVSVQCIWEMLHLY